VRDRPGVAVQIAANGANSFNRMSWKGGKTSKQALGIGMILRQYISDDGRVE